MRNNGILTDGDKTLAVNVRFPGVRNLLADTELFESYRAALLET